MATIIAKVAGIIGKNVLSANLRRPEPTPEPTPRQKAPGYGQKAGVYEQKAPGFGQKAPGFGQKAAGLGIIGIEKTGKHLVFRSLIRTFANRKLRRLWNQNSSFTIR
ncbi:MAG: hypothetical protein II864_08640 [Prevotella sp.]|nr:hypothetical protein [Prevotella sp.]